MTRIGLAQTLSRPGAAEANRKASVDAVASLFEQGADIVVAPEMAVPWYTTDREALVGDRTFLPDAAKGLCERTWRLRPPAGLVTAGGRRRPPATARPGNGPRGSRHGSMEGSDV